MTEVMTNTIPKRPSEKKQSQLGPYNLLQTLGEGEFGKVKLGVHIETGEEVAIKLIRKDGIGSDNRINKVEREISILKNLKHPYIVKLYNVLETEKYVGLVLEYASGGELFEYILAHRYLKEKDAKRFFAQLVSSVQYMHKCKIVHRDLKLENILIDKNRNIIVTDFGFANQFSTAADDMMATTCGSPCYAAPELVVNAGLYAGSAVDIWSCGVILFAMLSGFLPFDDDPTNPDSDDINQLYRYIVSTRLIFPSHISPLACDLMEKMLVTDPAKRCTLDAVIKHQWLDEYKDFLAYDKKVRHPLSDESKPPIRFSPVSNKEPLINPPVLPVHTVSATTSRSTRYRPTSSSKIPSFITRKPINTPKKLDVSNQPEKSLSTSYIPTDAIKHLTGSVRIHPHKEKILGFFGKSSRPNEEIDHSETSTLGNSSSTSNPPNLDETASKSILVRLAEESTPASFRDSPRRIATVSHRAKRNSLFQTEGTRYSNDGTYISNTPDGAYSTRFTMGDKAMAAVRKSIYRRNPEPREHKSQRNTWSVERSKQPKGTGKKMMDWIKKRSHGKQVEAPVIKRTPAPQAPEKRTVQIPQASRGRTLSINALAFVKEEESLGDLRIQVHQGPIDRTALTSRPPQRVIKDVSRILSILGIEVVSDEEEVPFVLRCMRRKASKRKEEGELQPIYGEPSIDNGEEIRFMVEICRFKNLPGLFIVNVKRLKGNVWTYKFLYHKLIDFLDLGKEDYMQKNHNI